MCVDVPLNIIQIQTTGHCHLPLQREIVVYIVQCLMVSCTVCGVHDVFATDTRR